MARGRVIKSEVRSIMAGDQKESILATTQAPYGTANGNKWLSLLLKWAPVAILLLTALIYCKAAFNKFSVYDDEFFILKNDLVKDISLDGLKAIFTSIGSGKYQPLTTLSFALEYKFFGFDPVPYHITNILLHLLSTWLVFKISERLGGNRITAIVVSVLFAIHPMHVEEVAWAAERKDMLYAFFYLAAILGYLRYISPGFKLKYFIVVFLLFIASLLSKSEAITLPVVLFAIDIFLKRKITLRIFSEKIPLLAGSAIIVLLSLLSQHSDGALGVVSTASYGVINRIFLFTSVPAFYILKLIAPFNLSAMHYYPDMHNGMLPWMYYASLPFLFGVIWLLYRLPHFFKPYNNFLKRHIIFGVSFFLITICVMPQLVAVGPALTPERYTYIPYIGLFFIIGQWLSSIKVPCWKNIAIGGFGLFVIMCCILTWFRIDVWKDSETLITDILEKNRDVADCSYFYWLRGNARLNDGAMADAIQDYTQATRVRYGYFDAYNSRGSTYFLLGNYVSAIRDYDTALRFSPNHARSYYNRAAAKATIGDYSGAFNDFSQFLNRNPDDNQAYLDRAMVRLTLKDSSGACGDLKKAMQHGNDKATLYSQRICK